MGQFINIKGELNPETNVGLNEYLREIKFSSFVPARKVSMSFNERRFLMIKITTYLLTLKSVSSGRTEVVIVCIILLSMLRQHLQKLF